YKHFIANRIEYVLIKQLLRSGVSIGANVEEAIGAQTKKDFIAKISISYKEARETKYWLRLLRDSEFLKPNEADLLLTDIEEILKILAQILKTSKVPNHS
ncbi:MAG: four helix bundle protein, partial [Sphingobacteriales bacterium]